MENAKCYAPQILVGTEGLPREQWLEYRRKGIGGSDAAAVLGISPFRTGRDLYYDKLNIVTADDAENWVQLEVGTLLEPLVAKIFAHKTGYKIYRRPFMFRHPQYPWMLADLDYMVELSDGTSAILEIKTTNYMTIHKSMGSEYDTVIIPLLAAHNVLLTRNLLYTAITRAKRRVLLVGEKRALYMAIHRSRKGKRNTMLGERIALYYKAVTRKALRNKEGEEWQRAS